MEPQTPALVTREDERYAVRVDRARFRDVSLLRVQRRSDGTERFALTGTYAQ